jgi:uncharacterized protein YjbI with pentapeptide repeats
MKRVGTLLILSDIKSLLPSLRGHALEYYVTPAKLTAGGSADGYVPVARKTKTRKTMTRNRFEKPVTKDATPVAPRIAEQLEACELEELEDEGLYSSLKFADVSFRGQHVEHVKFEASTATGTEFCETELKTARFCDVRFDRCNLTNAQWPSATLRRVEINVCGLTGLKVAESKLQDVVFKGCKAPLSSFRFAKLESVIFEGCNLTEADFYSAEFVNVVFLNCDLQLADFSRSKLKGVDLRGSNLDGIKAGPPELTGAIIEPGQAILLARAMGLDVR